MVNERTEASSVERVCILGKFS